MSVGKTRRVLDRVQTVDLHFSTGKVLPRAYLSLPDAFVVSRDAKSDKS